MALTQKGFELAITLVDTGSNATTKTLSLTSADSAAAATDAADVMAKFAALTDAKIKAYSINEVFVEDNFSFPTSAEVENQALLLFRVTTDPTKAATFTIPAPKTAIMVSSIGAGYNQVDLANADVVAFRGLFQGATNKLTISDGEKVSVLESGKRIHRKSRKG